VANKQNTNIAGSAILVLLLVTTFSYSQIYTEPNYLQVNVIEGTVVSTNITIINDTNTPVITQNRNIFGPVIDNNHVQPDYYSSMLQMSQTTQVTQPDFESTDIADDHTSISKNTEQTKIILPQGKDYKPDEILVRFRPLANGKKRSAQKKKKMLAHLGDVKIKKAYDLVPGLNSVKLPKNLNAKNAIKKFKNHPDILYVQPVYKVKANDLYFPDDPALEVQWALHNTGQSDGTPDADIDAPQAWDRLNNIPYQNIVVAVIDSGVEYNHPDIADNMWINQDEIPDNGLDDDDNGYVDDIYGYDFCNNDSDPNDDHYHGSHCAGIIAAITDNNEGIAAVAGTNNHFKIMALKFLDRNGDGWTDDAIQALEYSVMMGAKISNNSYGGPGFDLAFAQAVNAAEDQGVIFVAAAGNDYGQNNDFTPHYPASFSNDAVISVMASNNNDDMATFSNFGPTSVDIAAPGSNIVSLNLNKTYKYSSGTSMATPHVTAACAVISAINPEIISTSIKSIIINSVDPTLPDYCVSGGRLNLYNAIYNTPNPIINIAL
jgi:subtilisin family serine protease